MELVSKNDQKVLVAADDISKNNEMKKLSKLMIGDELPMYFLGTGIPENIDELKNVKDLTFLYRAPRIILEPLDLTEVSFRYKQVLEIPESTANAMAKLTKGYSFAFQALEYVYWENKPVNDLADVMEVRRSVRVYR